MYPIPDFNGPFKEELVNYIAHKRSLGYDYGRTIVYRLAAMNRFLLEQGIDDIKITKTVYLR